MITENTSGLWAVRENRTEFLDLSDELRWFSDHCRLAQGGVYAVHGAPGSCKSTLCLQIALDLGRTGQRPLYIANEQPAHQLKERATLMTSDWDSGRARCAMEAIRVTDSVVPPERLVDLMMNDVLVARGRYHGADLIIVDSVQGRGLSPNATKTYARLYEFARLAQQDGITVMLVAHATKRHTMAGPRTLEHNVDGVLSLRRAMSYRSLFVDKHRFGPACLRPVPLELDPATTRLHLCGHLPASTATARTLMAHQLFFVELQTSVALPAYGSRGRLTAPRIPRREIEQLVACLGQIDGLDMHELDYAVHCRVPGEWKYTPEMSFALMVSLLAAHMRREVPSECVFLGEVDLNRCIREVSPLILHEVVELLRGERAAGAYRWFCAPATAAQIQAEAPAGEVVACDSLETAIPALWPDVQA